MSQTLKKGHITKKEKGTGDFQRLYLEGIEFLQNLSGANWTDYNAHDPGVTILENLVYTLTNLLHKVNMPVNDILVESKGSKLIAGDNGFFAPSQILTTNPIIKDDYRKLLIDGVKNVKNVWIKTHSELQGEGINDSAKQNLKGLYHIYVALYDYDEDDEKRHREKTRITTAITKLYHQHRNLCEDVYEVTILDPLFLDMTLALTINADADGEEIFTQIYYNINDYLTHEATYKSLWELTEDHQDYSTIYVGPALKNGFVKDEELKPRKNTIFLSEITKIIAAVSGVVSIDHFEIKEDSPYKSAFGKKIKIKDRNFPRLRIPQSNEKLSFTTAEVQLRPNVRAIKKRYSTIEAEHYGSFKAVSQAVPTASIPTGETLGIASYYSIREQFPPIYGIGKYGLPKTTPKSRKAKAKQLKAFLLPFDQLMTNFLAQLTHLYTIYDTQESGYQSYFHQELEDMEDLKQLIKRNPDNKKERIEQWSNTLLELNTQYDQDAVQRLNQVADNLLARYGEQFPIYVLQKIHTSCYGEEDDQEAFYKQLLTWKRKLIANYGNLSYNRARSFNYMAAHDVEDTSGVVVKTPVLVDKISILLGIQHPEIKHISKLILDSRIGLYSYSIEELKQLDFEDITIIKELVSKLREYIAASKKRNADPTLELTQGIFNHRYQIKPHPKKKSSFSLHLNTEKILFKLFEAKTAALARKAKAHTIKILSKLNDKSEGIHLVEHLLLAPPMLGNHFGFSFVLTLDNGDKIPFKHVKLLSNENRNRIVASIQEQFEKGKKLSFTHTGTVDKYRIEIKNSKGKVLARSAQYFKHHHQVVHEIKHIKSSSKTLKPEAVTYFCYYHKAKIDESFFSFKMSFILPSWPIRFQQESFRKQFNNIVYEHAPIHIQYKSYWLNLKEITAFELAYFKWRKALSKNDKKAIMPLAYDLIMKIKMYQALDT